MKRKTASYNEAVNQRKLKAIELDGDLMQPKAVYSVYA